jgi:hypothetical protein
MANITNVQIIRKVQCPSVSTELRARGTDDAWLVTTAIYDSAGTYKYDFITLYVHNNGAWQGSVNDQCP